MTAPRIIRDRRHDADGLTAQQRRVLRFIECEICQLGRPPSLREIANHMGFASTNAASDHLVALERAGAIRTRARMARGIELVRKRDGAERKLLRKALGVLRRIHFDRCALEKPIDSVMLLEVSSLIDDIEREIGL